MSEKGAVDKLKDKLYSRAPSDGVNPDARSPLSASPREHTGRSWDGIKKMGAEAATPVIEKMSELPRGAMEGYSPKHRTFAARFLWGSIAFFAVALGAALLTFFVGGNSVSPSRIDLQIVAPSLIDSGKQTALQFIISNNNGTELKNADLIIDYPNGTRSSQDLSKPLLHERQTIGGIGANTQSKQTSSAVFYGPEGSEQTLKATLEYQIPNSNSIFTKGQSVTVMVGSAPVSVEVQAPSEAIAGQAFSMDITVKSNAATALADAALQIQAPFGFTLTGSSPQASAGGTLYKLGTLNPGDSQTVHITGTLDGQDGDARVFRLIVGSIQNPTDTQVKIPLLNVPQTLTVRKPFISAGISVDGKTGTVPEPLGKTLQGTVTWNNNLQDSVSNVVLSLSLKGAALDSSSVQATNGFYDSAHSLIIWSKDQDPELALVSPGQSGSLQFSFSTVPGTVTNPDITLNLTVHGTRAGQGAVPEDISSAASARVTLASSLSLAAAALHFSGAFANTGPMPPKANQATTYTIVWSVKNSSNSVSNAKVSAILPPNVQFLAAGPSANVSFDATTRGVTWSIGDLPPGVGYTSSPRQASFQVSLTPSISQVGAQAPLIGGTQLTALDRFANANIQANAAALTTRLVGDPNFTSGMDIVQSP